MLEPTLSITSKGVSTISHLSFIHHIFDVVARHDMLQIQGVIH